MIDQLWFIQSVIYVHCIFLIIRSMRVTLSGHGQLVQLAPKDNQSIPYWNVLAFGCAVCLRLMVYETGPDAYVCGGIASSLLVVVVLCYIYYENDAAKRGNRRHDWRTAAILLVFALCMEACVGFTVHPDYLPAILRG